MEIKQHQAMSATRRQIFGVALAAPFVLTGKAAAMTLGTGDHEYEVHHDWAKLPASVQLGYTHGVIEDAQGRIFIHNRSKDAVAIFDADGRFIKSWGARFEKGAHGLQLVKEGSNEFLFLSDPEGHEVVKATLDGEELLRIGVPTESGVYEDPTRFKPTNTAVAPNGDIYVADGYGLSYIHRYNKKGEYISTWGGKGAEAGKMNCPHGIWIDSPGMRELAGYGDPVDTSVAEIEALATQCRFRDCGHRLEPGCAVVAAVANGTLPAERVASFHKLQQEQQERAALQRDAQRRQQRISKPPR